MVRKYYIAMLYKEVMEGTKSDIRDDAIWICADETADRCGRYIGHLIFEKMNIEPSHPHLTVYR